MLLLLSSAECHAMQSRGSGDAYLHSYNYCLAVTLMGAPLFFQETLTAGRFLQGMNTKIF